MWYHVSSLLQSEEGIMNRRARDVRAFTDPERGRPGQKDEKQFDQLEASSLYCPRCKTAVPVRKRLLLILPEGERYEYLCARCFTSVGRKMVETKKQIDLILKP